MPRSIVERATHLLSQLEQKSVENGIDDKQQHIENTLENMSAEAMQLSIFETVDPTIGKIKEALTEMDLNGMTPIECMLKLNELKKMLE